ncbi:MAG: chemotaxis protein CheB [Promethearchaeota archaeon]
MIIEVLICADMAYKRKALSTFISSNPYMVIVNIARNGIDAMKMVEKYSPDIMVLDIKSDNLKFLYGFKELNKNHILPTIFILEYDDDINSIGNILLNLDFKEFYYVRKPEGTYQEQYKGIIDPLTNKILKITRTKYKKIEEKKKYLRETLNQRDDFYYNKFQKKDTVIDTSPTKIEKDESNELDLTDVSLTPDLDIHLETNIIVMGASVGGPKTFRKILKEIPPSFPSPILLVQHLDHFFMRQFAVNLKRDCNLSVKIPRNGEQIEPQTIYVSPGGYHMEIIVLSNKPCIRIFEGEPVNFCRPSVDVLFNSAARVYRNHTLGILLTGMGKDGVNGLLAIKKMGGKTIAESEETSILYGMPKMAKESKAADNILPNYKIKNYMINFAKRLHE